MNTIKLGNTVTWKGAGKLARLYGVKGTVVSGIVHQVKYMLEGEEYVLVEPTSYKSMCNTLVPRNKIISVK